MTDMLHISKVSEVQLYDTAHVPIGGDMMRLATTLFATTAMLCLGGFALGQEYWEYEPLEGEWERHSPTTGTEYEYEYGFGPEAEAEQYEWEPDEGYHEQEWYDPSDWFEVGSDIEYELDWDGVTGGYYDDDYYDDDWFYDYYDWE